MAQQRKLDMEQARKQALLQGSNSAWKIPVAKPGKSFPTTTKSLQAILDEEAKTQKSRLAQRQVGLHLVRIILPNSNF